MTTYNTIAELQNFIVLDSYTKLSQACEQPTGYQTEAALERELIEDMVNRGYVSLSHLVTPQALLANVRKQLQRLNNTVFTDKEWQRFLDEYLDKASDGIVDKTRKVQDDYIYYIVRKNGEDVVCKTVRMDDPDLVSRLYEAGTSMEAVEPQKQSIFLSLVIGYVIPIVIFVFLGRWLSKKMMSSMGGGPGGAMSFGKSNAKVYVKSSTGIKFTDVAGEDEAKELLTEIVDYLHNPQKYTEI